MARSRIAAVAAIILLMAAVCQPGAQASSGISVGQTLQSFKISLGPPPGWGVGALVGSQAHWPALGHNVASAHDPLGELCMWLQRPSKPVLIDVGGLHRYVMLDTRVIACPAVQHHRTGATCCQQHAQQIASCIE